MSFFLQFIGDFFRRYFLGGDDDDDDLLSRLHGGGETHIRNHYYRPSPSSNSTEDFRFAGWSNESLGRYKATIGGEALPAHKPSFSSPNLRSPFPNSNTAAANRVEVVKKRPSLVSSSSSSSSSVSNSNSPFSKPSPNPNLRSPFPYSHAAASNRVEIVEKRPSLVSSSSSPVSNSNSPFSKPSQNPTFPSQSQFPNASAAAANVEKISTHRKPVIPSPASNNAPTSPSSASSTSSSLGISPLATRKPPPSSLKPTLRPDFSNGVDQNGKVNYVWVQKDLSPVYEIPEDIQALIKKDIVPGVLKKPLSPSTYKDYFAALLYSEDFYFEKWNNFEVEDVALQLHKATVYQKKNKARQNVNETDKEDKVFVAFEIDSVPEKRPFLLSRDFVFVKPSGSHAQPYKGVIYRVVKSNLVLVEFGDDFFSQHRVSRKYDVSFSFNRICLKRCHQALEAVSQALFANFLFPKKIYACSCLCEKSLVPNELHYLPKPDAVQISRLTGAPSFVIHGDPSDTGSIICEAVSQIYRTRQKCKILIAAPVNRTCDVLMSSLKKKIPESTMFRANAAFREVDGVPDDILSSSLLKGDIFACPRLEELQKYKVVFSTFMSSFRLRSEGMKPGDFTHIFLVDASLATEPEALVTLANFADEKTSVVVTGSRKHYPGWVRSDIARRNGLKRSYFERLLEREA